MLFPVNIHELWQKADLILTLLTIHRKYESPLIPVKKKQARSYRTIFEIGISRMSSAPASLSPGIRVLTVSFLTTVWMLK